MSFVTFQTWVLLVLTALSIPVFAGALVCSAFIRENRRQRLAHSALFLGVAVLTVAGQRWGLEWRYARLHSLMEHAVARANQHYVEHGMYPEGLDVPCDPYGPSGTVYRVEPERQGFTMTCHTFFFQRYTYSSYDGSWSLWD